RASSRTRTTRNERGMSSSIWRTIRGWLGIEAPVSGNTRRTSRRERDRQQTRMRVSALGIVAVLAVTALIGGFVYDDIIKANAVLAQGADTDITREEYWKCQTV